ncbi:MAG: sortase [Anaerolineae bacterium]|nr:sortase [Anaerolineae bacterium]
MYRRRVAYRSRGSGSAFARLLLLGILLGTGFLAFDRLRTPPPPAAPIIPTLVPTNVPTVVPTLPPLPTATPPPTAILQAPTAGINAPVIAVYLDGASWDVSALGRKIGHLEGTGWLGKTGNIGLAAHAEMADGSPGIFARIDQVRDGDPIILRMGEVQQLYTVTEVKWVQPDDMSILSPTATDTLTLITCDDYNFIQNTYRERIVVIAKRIDSQS